MYEDDVFYVFMINWQCMDIQKINAEMEETVGVTARVDDGFFVRQNDGYSKVCFEDILWVEADNNYSDIHLRNGKVVCVIFSLSGLLKRLPPERFIRVHRSFVVNVFAVDRIVGNMLCIGKHMVDVSRRYRKSVFLAFDFLEEHDKDF